MTNENDSRAFWDVLVIGNVNGDFRDPVVLNPAVEYRDGIAQVGAALRGGKQFHAKMFDFHLVQAATIFAALPLKRA
jgi:hypothetical protein